ncbi:DUF2061 domain-containing protein [Gillisia sp. CAL575]|uniref:DUF2061 domain-containing protein n=1 Tax=Gillisia sp. CAL575 TaxID=985255 RepID=UPI00039A4393|nr:DUF2061 domain-containing protein [Gillisia sp. CAL575]
MLLDQVNKSNYKQDKVTERPLRSVLKAISWRVVGTIDTIVISWVLTGEMKTALAIGSVELVTKMLLYFGHERIWDRINYGRQ